MNYQFSSKNPKHSNSLILILVKGPFKSLSFLTIILYFMSLLVFPISGRAMHKLTLTPAQYGFVPMEAEAENSCSSGFPTNTDPFFEQYYYSFKSGFNPLAVTGQPLNMSFFDAEKFYLTSKAPAIVDYAGFLPLFCVPSSSSTTRYISNVAFLGTLNPDTDNSSLYTSSGYGDYTALSQKAKQIPGGAINMTVTILQSGDPAVSTVKAWVDWNRDGLFNHDQSEKIYDTSEVGALSGNVIFGFVVPQGIMPGIYTVRVRASSDSNFDSCGAVSDGEAEDYTFEVISDCSSKILEVEAAQQCGTGTVTLGATATSDTVSYKWYETEFGPEILGATQSIYTTQSLTPGNYTYYVTAYNGTCESTFRTPVKISVRPDTKIQFTQNSPEICGTISTILVSSTSEKEEVNLLEEKFENETANPVKFVNITEGNNNADGIWQLQSSPYVPQTPTYNVLKPAISSGYNNGKFAGIITDVRQKTDILNHWQLKSNLNTTGFTSLKMDFDLYFFSEEDLESKSYFKLQYSLNGGGTWINLKTYLSDVGVPSRFFKESLILPPVLNNQTQLKFRFSLFALGRDNEWMADIAALDNVRIYGNKDVPPNFLWSGDAEFLFNSNCSDAPEPMGSSSICLKPGDAVETKTEFVVTATTTLSNGCEVSHTITIPNNNKIWKATNNHTDWHTALWKPVPEIPDVTKCIIVKSPLQIQNGEGLGRNIIVEAAGNLTINSGTDLTVKDYIINRGTFSQFLVESDANLLQINDTAINSGSIQVKRNAQLKRLDYNYWASPVNGQNLKTFSPGTLNSRFYTYDESTDLFVVIDPLANSFADNGKGYAIRASNGYSTIPQTFVGNFVGVPQNNHPAISLDFTTGGNGFNLVGNPYPSNLDFYELADFNPTVIDKKAYFWTNLNPNPAMQGSSYPLNGYFNNYATLSGVGGIPATLGSNILIKSATPTKIIKVGQGFLVKAQQSASLQFKNSLRKADPNSIFFNKGRAGAVELPLDRYWLHLSTPLGVITTALVGYVPQASDGYDANFDADLIGLGADALFTKLNDHKLGIQGKQAPLNANDLVQLGTNHYEAGIYTFTLGEKEGVFANGQNIYLKDQQTGTVTNLSEGTYSFTANQGLTEGRFEIIYQPEPVLGTAVNTREALVVYRDGNDFVVKAPTEKITGIDVYDVTGRLLYTLQPNSNKVVISADHFVNGVYVLKINQGGRITSKKIMK